MLLNAIFSTWQGTQNPDTMPTFPRAKNAYAQPAHPSGRISFITYTTLQEYINTQLLMKATLALY